MNQATTSAGNVSASASASASAAGVSVDDTTDKNNQNTTPREFVVFSLYWDEWSRCIGSRYQTDHLYRVGKLDACSKQWKDMKLAAKAKFIQLKNPIEAQRLIDSTYYKKRTTISPTAGAIWEFKTKPGWD